MTEATPQTPSPDPQRRLLLHRQSATYSAARRRRKLPEPPSKSASLTKSFGKKLLANDPDARREWDQIHKAAFPSAPEYTLENIKDLPAHHDLRRQAEMNHLSWRKDAGRWIQRRAGASNSRWPPDYSCGAGFSRATVSIAKGRQIFHASLA